MPGNADNLISFVSVFAARVNSLDLHDIHPAATVTITHWLNDMRVAAENNKPALVAEYAQKVSDKITLERQFNAENEAELNR